MKILLKNVMFTLKHSFLPFAINLLIHGVYGVLPILAAYLWKVVIEDIQKYAFAGGIALYPVLFCVFIYCLSYGLSIALPVAFEVIDTLLRNSVKRVAQTQIHKKMDKIPYGQFEDAKINDSIINSSQTMVNGIFMYFSLNVTYFISDIVSLISSAILLMSYSKVLIFVYPVLMIPLIGYASSMRASAYNKMEITSLKRKMGGYEDYVSDLKYVKDTRILDCTNAFLKKRKDILQTIERSEMKSEKRVIFYQIITSLISAISYGIVLTIGMILMHYEKLSAAEYASLISLVGVINNVFNKVIDEMKNIPAEEVEIEAGFKLLDMDEGSYYETGISADYEVSLEDVGFKYPFSDEYALKNINLNVRKGQIVAIVGENGAGKTTLAKIILGLYEPTEGKACYDKREICKCIREELFSLTSAVFEDYNKYALTIEENISLSEKIEKERLDEALKLTNVDKIIQKFNAGAKTFLGKKYGGSDISGGEWQKIALARGYYAKSKIVILDEPTAALDPLAEYEMYQQFKKICKDRIGIIITHRLPAAAIADYIYYISNGMITEEGSHLSLISQNGEYANVYSAQKELFA